MAEPIWKDDQVKFEDVTNLLIPKDDLQFLFNSITSFTLRNAIAALASAQVSSLEEASAVLQGLLNEVESDND